ncbi:MAG: restriction endonuclease subunit S, partial [Terracidiphilus sp.]
DGLPKGWKSKTLSTKASAVKGQSPPSKFYNEDGIGLPFHQGVKDYGDRFPINRVYCTQVGRVAEPGDILFSVRAPVGRINISRDRIVIGRGLAALRARDGHQTMLFHQLRAHFYKEDMIGTGAIYAAVKKTDLFGVNLVSPPEPQVIEFEAKASALDKQVEILTAQNETLAKTRDLLLPRLMSGEVEV